jgi:hypothetical protein
MQYAHAHCYIEVKRYCILFDNRHYKYSISVYTIQCTLYIEQYMYNTVQLRIGIG